MAKHKEKPIKKTKKLSSTGNNWNIAVATDDEGITALLNDGYEPFSVDMGIIYLKKKGS